MCSRAHTFAAFALMLIATRPVYADAPVPAAKSVAVAQEKDLGPRWGVSLGTGFAAGSFYESSLGRQLSNAGFPGTGPGFFFRAPIEIDMRVFWALALGLSLDAQFGTMNRDRDSSSHGFHTLNALFLVRPSLQLWEPDKKGGVIIGVDLGAGGGTALWVVRNEVEVAPVYRLRSNLVVSYARRGLTGGFRLGVQYTGAGPFGPRQLHMSDWSSFIEPRLEWRW